MVVRTFKSSVAGRAIQKLFLYLILANFFLTGLYFYHADALPFGSNLLLTLLLIVYNVILCQLACRRARRQGDSYIIYPVVVTSILLCAIILFRLMLRP
ncbi:MAG: hypothetical protein ACRCYV_08000 [Aeromonas sp.]